ncbi:protein TIC 62, chloroplastic-like isoform X3 [Zingiber officinale]|uniref:protein TIC 62, chloroplastic-like isoform X3 n=1 Tax=Zingiber officinale TaxID=94328 RepID=UPI001C4A8A17|nr:protein TIC 62, chloroplastic-like isoform X3 [Zingiber officinale]
MALSLSARLPSCSSSVFEKAHKLTTQPPILPFPSNLAACGCTLLPASMGVARRRRQVVGAVEEQHNQTSVLAPKQSPSYSSSKLVLVIGASGGVGQLVVASLLSRNIKTRLLLRDPSKAISLFGLQDENTLEVREGDTRNQNDLDPTIFDGVTHIICCTGTTAFPSKRWDGDNTPERVDWEGIRNLVLALPPTLERLVLVSSIGVTKYNVLPWSIMNLFGVLKFKKMGEDFVRSSVVPFTIIRAGRLTDGPYTSYDLNTLLKATAGKRRAVILSQGFLAGIFRRVSKRRCFLLARIYSDGRRSIGRKTTAGTKVEGDKLVGEVSRLVVAEACIQALDLECTKRKIYEINSVEI